MKSGRQAHIPEGPRRASVHPELTRVMPAELEDAGLQPRPWSRPAPGGVRTRPTGLTSFRVCWDRLLASVGLEHLRFRCPTPWSGPTQQLGMPFCLSEPIPASVRELFREFGMHSEYLPPLLPAQSVVGT